MSSNKIHCECCNKDYAKSYFKRHLKSKKHLRKQEASGIVQPIVEQPPQDVSNKTHCECCNKHYAKSYYKRHLKSKTHIKKQTIFDNQQIVEDTIEIPTDLMDIIVGYKTDLEQYSDIDNFFDRVESGMKRCGNRLNISYTLSNEMKYSELLEMFHQVFGEEECLITFGLPDQQMEEEEYHNEIKEIFFQYTKDAGEKTYFFLLE